MDNPFIIKPYKCKELFCDREEELRLMLSNSLNYTDMTLISQRRLGKTGLIMRLFDEIKSSHTDISTIYVDILASRSLEDFIKMLAEGAMRTFKPKSSIGDKFMSFIKSLRPQLSFDNITGEPQLQLTYNNAQEKEYTLRGLFEFLDRQDTHIVIAIDEFQQIREYPEENMEALLRTYIQHTHNLTFIFSGSKKHMMTDIFVNEKKPFYSSTTFVSLDKISYASYSSFIKQLFTQSGKQIDDDAIHFILEWTRRHTYYTQQLCHTIFANGNSKIDTTVVKKACNQLLDQGEYTYLQYRQMLTPKQWNFLIAVAKEETVYKVTSADFLTKYKLGTPSTITRFIDSLLEKGLLNDDVRIEGTSFSINDVFFSHWLERL